MTFGREGGFSSVSCFCFILFLLGFFCDPAFCFHFSALGKLPMVMPDFYTGVGDPNSDSQICSASALTHQVNGLSPFGDILTLLFTDLGIIYQGKNSLGLSKSLNLLNKLNLVLYSFMH